jgi:hypothetical protein
VSRGQPPPAGRSTLLEFEVTDVNHFNYDVNNRSMQLGYGYTSSIPLVSFTVATVGLISRLDVRSFALKAFGLRRPA